MAAEYKIYLLTPAKGPLPFGLSEVANVTERQITTRADVLLGSDGSLKVVAVAPSTNTRLGSAR